jgi:hypothetical protein
MMNDYIKRGYIYVGYIARVPRRTGTGVLAGLALILSTAGPAAAQAPSARTVLDLTGGWIGFIDESLIHHAAFGGAVRFHLTPRISVGPEVIFALGPGDDSDIFLTGNLTFDFVAPQGTYPQAVPFVVAGGGWFRHSDTFGNESFSSSEGALTAGGGVRVRMSEAVAAGVEFRTGWEPHMRVTGFVSIAR